MTPRFSVVIPVKNGARFLREVLAAVAAQGEEVETLVIDSGSTDGSIDIARAAGARVLEIPPEEFAHGRTRNLGARETAGELICFLTQDATPAPGWLAAYREAFALSDRVGAAYGPHLPRPDTPPMIARELTEFFGTHSANGRPVLQRAGDPTYLANVNACYRRACWRELRFPDIRYAEDQAFGRAMMAAGWEKVYHPGAAVNHAHDYGPVDFMRRYFDEYRGLRETVGHVERFGLRTSVREVRRQVGGDRRWMRAQGWPAPRRMAWTARSAVHHGGRRVFSALGSRAGGLPAALQRKISLEGIAVPPPQSPPTPVTRRVEASGPHVFASVLELAREGPAPLLDPVPGMAERTPLHVAFVIPPFRRGSGGHHTISRLVCGLEDAGHTCSIWLHDTLGWQESEWPAVVRGNIREFFEPVQAPAFKGFDHWYGADVAVATGWDTAYPVMRLERCRARAYLLNDHETEFFATSAESFWAEQTYTFDLFPIASSPWLRTLLTERYGAPAAAQFDLGSDRDVYAPRPVPRRRDTVIFYARSVTPRRAVPLGMLALEELYRRRPELRIVLFGDLDPPAAAFPYEHLGVASPDELSWAYSEATVGLCLSMTNHSLIPLEMLACGLPCIDLGGVSSDAVFGPDGPVELAPFDPVALADGIERLLDEEGLWERRSRAGLEFVAERTWERAAQQTEAGLREALRQRERNGHDETPAVAPGHAGGTTADRALTARAVPLALMESRPTTARLFGRLDAADISAVEVALTPEERAHYERWGAEQRAELALLYGAWHGVPAVLEKTGLRPDEPPPDVHAMARGPLAAAGALYYADLIADELRRIGRRVEDVRRGLDFGCSSGRVVRALQAAYPDTEWHGCDPNAPAIAWATANLPPVRFLRSPQEPPLPYDDDSFDLVAAISIWSHFNEPNARAWLDEMRRIVRPGGVLLLTVHGLQSIAYFGQEGLRSARQLAGIREEMYRRGFWFRDEFGAGGDWGVRHRDWGTAFTSPEWVLRHVVPQWRVADYAVGLNAGNQDVVVLVRQA